MNSPDLPLLSIIMPTKNGETYIADSLNSIFQQDYPNFEVIVIDGNSTDTTCAIVREFESRYPNIKLFSADDRGQSDAMNKGLKEAKGELLGFLNDDDFYSKGCFREAVAELKKMSEPALVVGNCRFIDEGKKECSYQKPRFLGLEYFVLGGQPHPANSSQYFYHKKIHGLIGEFPTDEHLAMDLWFYLECCASKKIKIKYVDRDWGNFRFIPGTKTFQNRHQLQPIIKDYQARYRSKVQFPLVVPALVVKFMTRIEDRVKREFSRLKTV